MAVYTFTEEKKKTRTLKYVANSAMDAYRLWKEGAEPIWKDDWKDCDWSDVRLSISREKRK